MRVLEREKTDDEKLNAKIAGWGCAIFISIFTLFCGLLTFLFMRWLFFGG